jgi:hypothetical protein
MSDTLTVRERREVGTFSAVELRYFGQVFLHHGEHCGLEIEGDPDVVPKVRGEVRDETLLLEVGDNWLERLTSGLLLVANRPLRYHVTLPRLQSLAVAGSGDVGGDGWAGDHLRLRLSGQGEVRLTALAYRSLEATISGRGELQLAGEGEEARLTISGSAEVAAPDLRLDRAEIRIAGQGNVEVRVRERLDVRIAGFGTVRYHGDPTVKQVITGAGSVVQAAP